MKKVMSLVMSIILLSLMCFSTQSQAQEQEQEIKEVHIITDEDLELLHLTTEDIHCDTCLLVSQSDATRLMKIAKCEGGDDMIAQALIMRVILNRLKDENFPGTIDEIIHQYKQFSTVNNGKYDEAEPNTESHYALALVESGWDESEGAVYFEASFLKTSWQQKHREFLFEYEGTRYYK